MKPKNLKKVKKSKKLKLKILFYPITFLKIFFSKTFKLFKKIIKDLKRVRWPKKYEMKSIYWKVVLFIIIAALTLFALAIGFEAIWNALGVGING